MFPPLYFPPTPSSHNHWLQFVSRYISTIGVDFGVKNVKIDGHDISINFWDLSGHPEFFEVRNEFYRDTQGVRSFSLNSRDHSIVRLIQWVSTQWWFPYSASKYWYFLCSCPDLRRFCLYTMLVHGAPLTSWTHGLPNRIGSVRIRLWLLCAPTRWTWMIASSPNRKEANGQNRRAFSTQSKLRESLFLTRIRCRYFETSAKSGENVNEVFSYLLSGVVSKTNTTPGRRMSSTTSRASAVHASWVFYHLNATDHPL